MSGQSIDWHSFVDRPSSYITNAYDNVARLRFTKLKNSSHTTLDAADYGYNASHQRTTFTNAAGTRWTNSYDRIGQLKITDSSVNSEDRGYTYDAAWNLNYRTNNGTTSYFNVNSLNELTTTSLGSATYDGNGNLTSSHSGARSYVYDDENRLVELYVGQNENATEFVYDGLGRLRIRREYTYDTGGGEESLTAPGGLSAATSQSLGGGQSSLTVGGSWTLVSETHYVYDGWRVIQERDGSNVPTASYTRGTDLSGSLEGAGGIGGLLARSYGYAGGNWSTHTYYHADGNGNVTYLVNSSQTQAAFYRYDPFGNLIDSSDNLTSPNPYRFSSKEVHLTSGLYYYGYRFYDPQNQRWQNRDPLGELGGLNLFAYCYNDPIRYYDAFGLDIEVDPKDKADYDAAKKKLCKDPKMAAEFHVMEHAKKKVILKTNSSDDDSVTRGPGKPDIINWDPRSALKTKDGGKQSPALGLGHEVAHANKNKWDSTSDPNYGNAEERRVIQGPEASTAKTLGEDGRKDHEGTTYHVPSPTKR